MKKITAMIICMLCAVAFCITAYAAVPSTTKPGSEKGFFIAGNPDLYPLEYYDEEAKSYRGILPEFFEEVSEKTGIEFIYVSAGKENRQQELAENRKVDIISVYEKGTVETLEETELFSYEKDGKTVILCLGFSETADPGIIAAVKSEIEASDKEMWLSAAMELKEKRLPWAIIPVTVLLAIIIVGYILIKIAPRSRNRKKLLSALENEEFRPYYQFILDTKTNSFSGAEVLARWHSPSDGILSPAVFLDDFKAAGISEKLDFYMLEKVCRTLESWQGGKYDSFYLSCNFTRLSLTSKDFSEKFREIISKYDFDKSKLTIEITEDSIARNSEISCKNVVGIKELGCRISIDDIGSGYTSFSDLCEYPVDIIKIDRSIILKSDSERGYAVLKGLVRLGHDIGINVVCEGVEKSEEDERVRCAGCDYIQGFLFSKPLPEENAMEYLDNFMNKQDKVKPYNNPEQL